MNLREMINEYSKEGLSSVLAYATNTILKQKRILISWMAARKFL